MIDTKATATNLDKNIVRLRGNTFASNYVEYIVKILTEENHNEVIISSLGNTISKAVTVAEMVKHRVVGLHQVTTISTQALKGTDEDESRKVTSLRVVLSKNDPNVKGYGY